MNTAGTMPIVSATEPGPYPSPARLDGLSSVLLCGGLIDLAAAGKVTTVANQRDGRFHEFARLDLAVFQQTLPERKQQPECDQKDAERGDQAQRDGF